MAPVRVGRLAGGQAGAQAGRQAGGQVCERAEPPRPRRRYGIRAVASGLSCMARGPNYKARLLCSWVLRDSQAVGSITVLGTWTSVGASATGLFQATAGYNHSGLA
jgi:hypothetical protein